jgi:hypothetical protein
MQPMTVEPAVLVYHRSVSGLKHIAVFIFNFD